MTPTEQRIKDFEVYAKPLRFILVRNVLAPNWTFLDPDTERCFYVWQAAADLYERKGMERARDVCKEHAKAHEHPIIKATALLCADAIEREIGKC